MNDIMNTILKNKFFNKLLVPAFGLFCMLTSCSDNDFSNEYYEDNNTYYDETYRPSIHFTPEKFWVNDPNGMVYYDGEYHLFYQFNPYGPKWGHMSWGHAVSTDMIHWEELSPALYPDELGDIFSGSIVIDKNNSAGFGKDAMVAIYTSNGAKQTQCIAYSLDKGRTFTKYEYNPVLVSDNPDLKDFRDPKVFWHEASGKWVMSLATHKSITFYSSSDLLKWNKLSEFKDLGMRDHVWECPDLFPLQYNGQTKWVLLVSINPGAPNGGSGTQYFIGDFNGTTFTADLSVPYPIWIDYGKDNYAGVTWDNVPQTDGRRLQIGWMSNWQYAGDVPTNTWRGGMTMPKELTLKTHPNGYPVLASGFVTEISKIGANWSTLTASNNEFKLGDVNDSYQLNIDMNIGAGSNKTLKLENEMGENFVITIDRSNNTFVTNRKQSGDVGFSSSFAAVSTAPLNVNSNNISLSIVVDKGSVEVLVNDGVSQQTNLVFPKKLYNKVILSGSESSVPTIKCRKLNSTR